MRPRDHSAGEPRARWRIVGAALALWLAATPASAGSGPARTAGPSRPPLAVTGAAPTEVLVRFAERTGASARAQARRRSDTRLGERLPLAGLELVRLERGTSAAEAIRRLEREPGVLYAEPNHERRAARMPGDPYFGELWGLHNTGQSVNGSRGAPDADVDGPEAWDVATGAPGVTVAVVDSGVSRTHPDLASNSWTNPGESGAGGRAGVDDDGNGYVDDIAGWDWVDSDADPSDAHGHGTHVAGTIAARGDNALGVTGVAWRAGLMALRVLDEDGNGTVADAIEAYAYAGSEGADVLNASLGGPGFSRAEYEAIRSISDVLFVAAAGNAGDDNNSVPEFPCSYELPSIVCVAASGQRDGLAGFSNYGARTVDLAAPGTTILSTWPGGRYAYSSGTSMAAPHVSGAAVLRLAQHPGARTQSIKDALLAGVDLLPALAGRTVTGGRLNVHATLVGRPVGAAPPPPAPPPPQPAAPIGAAPDRTPPRIRLRVRARQRLRRLLRRGLRARVSCSEGCTVRAQAVLGRRSLRDAAVTRAGLTLAGRDTKTLSATRSRMLAVRLRPRAKRYLARARRPLLRLKVSATDAAGNVRAATRRIRVRRR